MNDASVAPPPPPSSAPPPPPPSPPPPGRGSRPRLHRSRENKILGGVAAGVAETFGLDVLLVRVIWVLAAFVWFGIPLYLVAWIALPGEGDGPPPGSERTREISLALGLGLIALGVFIAFDRVFPGRPHVGRITWPVFLIVGGIALLLIRRTRDDDVSGEIPPPTPGGPESNLSPSPPVSAPESAAFANPVTATTTGADDPDLATVPMPTSPVSTESPTATEPPTTAWTQTAPWPAPPYPPRPPRLSRPPRPPRRPRPHPFLTPLALSVLLIGAGLVALLDALDVAHVGPTIVLASGLAFVGAVLILATWVGRARMLIFVGIVLAVLAVTSAVLDVPLHGGWGDRSYVPTTRADLRPKYELSGGQLHLDLRRVPLANEVTRIEATVGFGQLRVDVPLDVQVVAHARASAGNIELFGHIDDGIHIDSRERVSGSKPGVLRLELRVGAGQILVRRFDRSGGEVLIEGVSAGVSAGGTTTTSRAAA